MLYLTAPSMAASTLDGNEVIKVEIIDRKPYVCTNDLVRVDPDGRINYLGRANRFFMRDDGRKYESGRVETEFSRLKDIESCAIVPVYYKIQHDTIPMLCVKLRDGAGEPLDVMQNALRQVFIEKKTLPEDDIPSRVMLAETLPRNSNGKIDLYKLNRGEVSGEVYTVEPVRTQDQLTDFALPCCEDETGDIVEQVLESISSDIKSKAPGSRIMRDIKKGTSVMEDGSNKLYENFNSLWYMHRQMMENMFGMMGQCFPWVSQFMSFAGSSELQSLMEIMPNMEGAMSGMKKMFWGAPGFVPGIPFMIPGMAGAMMPMFHEQAVQMFSCMDQIAFDTIQRVFEMNRQFGDKMFDMAMKMAGPSPAFDGGGADDDDVIDVEAEVIG